MCVCVLIFIAYKNYSSESVGIFFLCVCVFIYVYIFIFVCSSEKVRWKKEYWSAWELAITVSINKCNFIFFPYNFCFVSVLFRFFLHFLFPLSLSLSLDFIYAGVSRVHAYFPSRMLFDLNSISAAHGFPLNTAHMCKLTISCCWCSFFLWAQRNILIPWNCVQIAFKGMSLIKWNLFTIRKMRLKSTERTKTKRVRPSGRMSVV